MISNTTQLREAIEHATLYICVACCKNELFDRQDKIDGLIKDNYYPRMLDVCSDDEIEEIFWLLKSLQMQALKTILAWT